MSKDRTKKIKRTMWFERAALLAMLLIAALGITVEITAIGITGFVTVSIIIIIEALWTQELQLEEIKENVKVK